MKILIDTRLLSTGNTSGIEEYTRFIVDALLEHDKENSYRFFYSGLKHAVLPGSWRTRGTLTEWRVPNKLLEASMRLFRKPDIASRLSADLVFSPHFNLFPESPNSKRVITFHDLSFEHYPEFYPLRKRIWHWQQDYARQANRADALIAVSEFTKYDIVKTLGVSEAKVHVIHSGVNPRYTPIQKDDPRLSEFVARHRLLHPFILFVGTVEPRKNISGLIRAFELVKKQPFFSELQLIIVGRNGWLYDTILKEAKNSSHSHDIRFWGGATYEELHTLYNLAEVFVYPSIFEGFGFPPLEAQACGTPVITSNRSSLPEIIGDSGILVDPWKVNEIADAITAVVGNSTLREELIRRGFANVSRFSWDAAAKKLISIFTSTHNDNKGYKK